MINYWDFSGSYLDKIGTSHMFGATNVTFVPNRNKISNSAIYVNEGYIILPNGTYFDGTFTVTAWINIQKHTYLGSFLEIAEDSNKNIYRFNYAGPFNPRCLFSIYSSSTVIIQHFINSEGSLDKNNWMHFAYTVNGSSHNIYVNGSLSGTLQSTLLSSRALKTSNYIGKSVVSGMQMGSFILDELKIFNKPLNLAEIQNDMSLNN